MTMKKVLCLLITAILLIASVAVFAKEDIKWSVDEKGILTIEECGSFLTPDSELKSYGYYAPWTKNEKVVKIIVPDNVTWVNTAVFASCPNLKEIVLSKNLERLTMDPLFDCTNIERVSISEENELFKAVDGVLYSKDGKNLILYPAGKTDKEVTIPYGVEEINAYAFKNALIEKINFPQSLKTIKDEAFAGCRSLTEISLPDSVTYIGQDAFLKCDKLSEIKFPPYVYLQNNPFKDTEFFNNPSNWEMGALYLNQHLLSVDNTKEEFQIKPDTVSIAGEVFGGTKLKRITIPSSVISIGDMAFALTEASTEIIFEEGLKILGYYAFYRSKIQNVTLPQSLEIIGGYAFCDSSIKTIVIPDKVIDLGVSAFEGCSLLESAVIGKSVGNIGEEAFSGCYSVKEITIPDSVYKIADGALRLKGLEKIHLGKNLQEFTSRVFGYDYPVKLSSITVSEESEYLSVKDNVVFDKKGEKILFYPNAKKEESYIIPEGVKIIGEKCFDYNAPLINLTIPKSVTHVEKYNNPSKLVNVAYTGTREEWEKIFMDDGNHSIKNAVITFSDQSKKNLYENLRYIEEDGVVFITGLLDKSAKSVIVPGEIDGMKVKIKSYAFESSKLESVKLHDTITEIPDYAFWYCTDLKNINLEKVEHIGGRAFMYCKSLEAVNLLNIKSWDGISEDRIKKETMELRLLENPWLYTYNTSSMYTPFYGAEIETLRIKWPEENFEKDAKAFPGLFLNCKVKNAYFENFTVKPSSAEFYGIDTSRYNKTVDPYMDLTYPDSELTIFGNSEEIRTYAEDIGVNFKYTD